MVVCMPYFSLIYNWSPATAVYVPYFWSTADLQLWLSMCLISSWSTADHQLQPSMCLVFSWSPADHQLQPSMCLLSSWSTADHQLQLSMCVISSWSTVDHQLGLATCLISSWSTADISRYNLSQQAERFIARNRSVTKIKISNYWDYNCVYYSNICVKWFTIA